MPDNLFLLNRLNLWIILITIQNGEYLETKCVLSGQNETPRTHEPCPDRVPAKLACCL